MDFLFDFSDGVGESHGVNYPSGKVEIILKCGNMYPHAG